jgi:hypothetical protein
MKILGMAGLKRAGTDNWNHTIFWPKSLDINVAHDEH